MALFFGWLFAALIGAMLGPYFVHFLNIEKTKLDLRLKYLEDAYLLANKISSYVGQQRTNMVFQIAALKNQINFESLPKYQEEEPFAGLHVLFDFHLNAPQDLTDPLRELNNEIIESYRPITEAINKHPQIDKDDCFRKAILENLKATDDAMSVQTKVIEWIKTEKNKIQEKPTIFEAGYYVNMWHKIQIFTPRDDAKTLDPRVRKDD